MKTWVGWGGKRSGKTARSQQDERTAEIPNRFKNCVRSERYAFSLLALKKKSG